jgi:hypothetical protein
MSKTNKKPQSFSALAGKKDQGSVANCDDACADHHRARIARLGLLKQRAKDQEQYIYSLVSEISESPSNATQDGYFQKRADRMASCGHYLMFRDYYTIGQVKLVDARTCQLHMLCPLCAHNRAGKQVRRYLERLDFILLTKPRLKPIFITLTVKNGVDLSERFEHLSSNFKHLMDRRRDSLKKDRGYVEFSKIKGAVFSYEVTFNESTSEWHPHLHMFALVDEWIDRDVLMDEWLTCTGDSHVVDVRRVRKVEGGYGDAFCEVFKYALKFSDMSVNRTLEAYLSLTGRRMQGSVGLFWGVKIPDSILDEPVEDQDLPYIELLYKFAARHGYSVAATKHVQPATSDKVTCDKVTCDKVTCDKVSCDM